MRRILSFRTLRSLMQLYPEHPYCIYKHMCFLNVPSETKNVHGLHRLFFSTKSSLAEDSDNSFALLQEEFPEPKKIFYQVLNEALFMNNKVDISPSITMEHISGTKSTWKAKIAMKWPENFEVEGSGSKKADALNIAFLYACQRLKHLGVIHKTEKNQSKQEGIVFKDADILSSKGDLFNLYKKFWHRTGSSNCFPKFKTEAQEGFQAKYWKTELFITYPEEKIFEGVASRSKKAEGIAAHKALKWLQNQGIINKNFRLIDYTKEDEIKLKQRHLAPYSISVPLKLQDKMQAIFKELEEQKTLLSGKSFEEKNDFTSEDFFITDAITEKPFCHLSQEELSDQNQLLYEKFENLTARYSSDLSEVNKTKLLLPIFEKREDILKLIDENQVVVLSGDTGCGKSTQVPQYILHHFIKQMKGAECNIIVTQPRRISAVSLADRVAYELGEKIGEKVGYQIRLKRCLPEGNGAILYCTTGMLLRKLRSNSNLEGISHVIIDEVHERNIQIDFILILLKKILQNNKNIKLILMSASFNTDLFVQYFDSAKIIHVPGKMFPVKEIFLEDLFKNIPTAEHLCEHDAQLDPDLVVDVINYIDKNQPPGAILCFLPGWHDIVTVKAKLFESQGKNSKLIICPVHSRLPHEEQKKIFIKAPNHYRKVILATNIGETSITVDDVVYVVNSGLHKGTKLDIRAGIASLSTQWITKANVCQRKGRAGRVMPGKCYHLFSKNIYDEMEDYPTAEILRMPLESVILDCKLYCPNAKAEEILSQALEPPATDSIEKGIQELQLLGVLDEKENLTDLGLIVVQFATHPRLSVSLIYAAFLRCLDPILTLCAILTLEKEPFLNSLEDKYLIRKIKRDYDNGLCSDHIALIRIFDEWQSLKEETSLAKYIEKNFLDDQSLIHIKQLKELFAEDLYNARIIPQSDSYCDSNSMFNAYSSSECNILAALTPAFFPNVIKIIQGDIMKGKINKNNLIYSIIKGQKAHIQKESVASDIEELPSPWLLYFSALKSEVRRKALVSSVSTIPGICLLLLTGKEINMKLVIDEDLEQKTMAVLSIDNYDKLHFSCSEREACLLLDCREYINDSFKLYLQSLDFNVNHEYVLLSQSKLIPLLTEIFKTPQVPFVKGQVFKFVNNELISKEL